MMPELGIADDGVSDFGASFAAKGRKWKVLLGIAVAAKKVGDPADRRRDACETVSISRCNLSKAVYSND